MAQVTVKQLNSPLAEFPGDVASADTIVNSTTGLLTFCLGVATTQGSGVVFVEKEGSRVSILPGAESAAITIAADEQVFLVNDKTGMSGTVDTAIISAVAPA